MYFLWDKIMHRKEYVELDDTDVKILRLLQSDATQSIQDIADQVALTSNPCWRRIKRLEENGVIKRRVAVVDPRRVGLGITAFVTIHTDKHTKDWLELFNKSVGKIPEIVECHRMTGDVDYLLKVLVQNLEHYDAVYQRLLSLVPDLKDVSAAFSMERMKDEAIIDVGTVQNH
jgi:Lrp/AsnC family transcriptional regulator